MPSCEVECGRGAVAFERRIAATAWFVMDEPMKIGVTELGVVARKHQEAVPALVDAFRRRKASGTCGAGEIEKADSVSKQQVSRVGGEPVVMLNSIDDVWIAVTEHVGKGSDLLARGMAPDV
jgi:hypothetical protein